MKLGVNMYTFNHEFQAGNTDVRRFLEFCGSIDGVEGVDLLSYFWTDEKEEVKLVPHWLEENNLQLAAYSVGNNFLHEDPAQRQQEITKVKQGVDVAAELGAPVLRVFGGSLRKAHQDSGFHKSEWGVTGGSLSKDSTMRDALDLTIKSLRECTEYAEEMGVVLGIENHDVPGTGEETVYVVEGVASDHFGVIIDPGNIMNSKQDPHEGFRQCLPYAVHIHLKNKTKVPKSHPEGFEPLGGADYKLVQSELEDGEIDWPLLIKDLEQVGYDGFLCLEYELTKGMDELRRGVERSMAYARSLLEPS